ncbi:hypothetical protein KSX_67520 [Ktedonospora formicarum]|uniref:Uncharacterized protein n=1 Tax=Ktedonospora formicarum TaxID=2778364 RepID=A0A8J3IAQ4_9CHLR|nr:hypothetical protein KSX_67520 [Ktedonospora formicarum]
MRPYYKQWGVMRKQRIWKKIRDLFLMASICDNPHPYEEEHYLPYRKLDLERHPVFKKNIAQLCNGYDSCPLGTIALSSCSSVGGCL